MSKKKKEEISIRSSAAEYLTFVAASGQSGIEAVYADEDIFLSQKMMAVLYDVNVRTINEHLKKVFADSELQEASVIRKFRITASDGKNHKQALETGCDHRHAYLSFRAGSPLTIRIVWVETWATRRMRSGM